MCAMQRCLAPGLVYQDAEFRNVVYNPDTLQVRIIDLELPKYTRYKPEDIWASMDASFDRFFNYKKRTCGFWWALFPITNMLMKCPWDLGLYLPVASFLECDTADTMDSHISR